MALVCEIKGVNEVIRDIQVQKKRLLQRLTVGLKRAGLYLQRMSMEVVPVDTGNLRGGAFTRASGEGTDEVVVHVGYTADYAIYVHEDLDAWHRPGKEAKFLEGPARKGIPRMRAIVKTALGQK